MLAVPSPTDRFIRDVLDEFEAKPKITEAKPTSTATIAPTASGPGRPSAVPETAVEDAPDEDLAQQLQAGMASLIGELGENPDMQKQFEDMMQELIAAGQAPTEKEAAEHVRKASDNMPQEPSEATKASAKKQENFQDTIKKTMERMQQSGDAATQASASAGGDSEEEMLAKMLKELGGGDEGGEQGFNSMLMSMMTQLTNKEILYEPMKELHEKYPAWMEQNKDKAKKEDMIRFREQQRLVDETVARFERKGYSDDNEDDREYIVERMQKVS